MSLSPYLRMKKPHTALDVVHSESAVPATPATVSADAESDLVDTLRKRVAELEASQERTMLALAGSGTGIWDRNVVTGEIHYSPAWKAIIGYAPHELSSRIEDAYLRLHPDDVAQVQTTMQAHFEQRTDCYSVEHRIRCKDGTYKWICSRGKVVSRDRDGHALRMVGTSTDITALREMASQLHALATTDHLTQLPNRRHFMMQSEGELKSVCNGNNHGSAVLVFDLDHFKTINDRWGHAFGDRALTHFAGLLRAEAQPGDILGRLGGEEFAAVLPDTSVEDAIAFAQRVQHRGADTPLMQDHDQVILQVSIGIDHMRQTDDGVFHSLDRADKALYRAKRGGRNRIEIYAD